MQTTGDAHGGVSGAERCGDGARETILAAALPLVPFPPVRFRLRDAAQTQIRAHLRGGQGVLLEMLSRIFRRGLCYWLA